MRKSPPTPLFQRGELNLQETGSDYPEPNNPFEFFSEGSDTTVPFPKPTGLGEGYAFWASKAPSTAFWIRFNPASTSAPR